MAIASGHPRFDPISLSLRASSVFYGAGNTVYNMQDAGIAILESFDAQIYDNTFEDVKYGVRISLGGGQNSVHDNVLRNCSKCG